MVAGRLVPVRSFLRDSFSAVYEIFNFHWGPTGVLLEHGFLSYRPPPDGFIYTLPSLNVLIMRRNCVGCR